MHRLDRGNNFLPRGHYRTDFRLTFRADKTIAGARYGRNYPSMFRGEAVVSPARGGRFAPERVTEAGLDSINNAKLQVNNAQ